MPRSAAQRSVEVLAKGRRQALRLILLDVWRRHVVLLNVLGLTYFVGAVGSGVLTGNNSWGILREGAATDVFQPVSAACRSRLDPR
jgi:hypothetical protein